MKRLFLVLCLLPILIASSENEEFKSIMAEIKSDISYSKSELKKLNIYFAGIDFINGKLIGDINVTSPTGLKTYHDLTGINLAKYFFDNI